MREQYIRNSLNTILTTWSNIIQLKQEELSNSYNVILVDSIYQLFTCICQLLQLDGNYILDIWEQKDYNIDNTVDYIINNNFEVISD